MANPLIELRDVSKIYRMGDFKLFALFGAWLGTTALLNTVLLASLLGIAGGLIAIALKRHRYHEPLPFAPFIALGGFTTLLYGPSLVNTILHGWL